PSGSEVAPRGASYGRDPSQLKGGGTSEGIADRIAAADRDSSAGLCPGARRDRVSTPWTATVRGQPRNAGLLCTTGSGKCLLLCPPVLELRRRRVVRRPELEWSVDGRSPDVRACANSPRSRPLLSRATAALEGVAR